MNDEFRYMVIEALRRGEELPAEWARALFPPEKREYEMVYHGKEREEDILANAMSIPLQPLNVFGSKKGAWQNQLVFGDNLQAMKRLLEMKKDNKLRNADGTPGVRLIYIDPPFATKQEFRDSKDQQAYQDKVSGARFIEFLRTRLILMRELLSDDGSIYLHLDSRKAHYMKVIMDEIFGENNFQGEIIWKRTSAHSDAKGYASIHDILLFYTRTGNYIFNQQYGEYSEEHKLKRYKHVDSDGRRFADDNLIASGLKGGGYTYAWRGVTKEWRCPIETMRRYEAEDRLYYTRNSVARVKRYLDELPGKPVSDVWSDIFPVNSQAAERIDYPTQKPESLLHQIISSSSNPGDIVLDAFAGSGTALATAEKLNRRWIGIDCGKLAIYTIQKRMLNLKKEIGNRGDDLQARPFTLYSAGLYDFSTLRQLPWEDWRFFALQLFGCKDEAHTIGGMKLDGKRQGASVLVFNHLAHPGQRIDERTVGDIHSAIGQRISAKFFIIAPRNTFDFQQDYIDLEGVRYYALRIPYSFINELHHREFTALEQPKDETAVNEIIDAYGFDFIRPPQVTWTLSMGKGAKKGLHIEAFQSRAYIRGKDTHGGLETLSMVMLDYDYNGDVFDLDAVFYAQDLQKADWRLWFPLKNCGEQVMIVFIDIYGNEARELIPRSRFDELAKTADRQKETAN